jgi:hypothetical protein
LKSVCRQTAHVDAITAWKVSCSFISGMDDWMSFGNYIIGRQLRQEPCINKIKHNKINKIILLYYINKPTWCNFVQSHLFFIEIYSACFGRLLHPSSGVQLNCSYSHRYISVSVWYGLNLLPDVQGRESIA